MGMIQTESPYFQPVPKAPQPFAPGLFPNDPTFNRCSTDSARGCAVSWAVRIIDSASVYILGAGLYSWFVDYSQDCVKTENCQARGFEIEQTSDIWIYNLCTKAIEEMISPLGALPTYANKNQNGFLASVLAWLQGSVNPAGERNFEGFRMWTTDALDSISSDPLPDRCRSALTEIIRCDNRTEAFQSPEIFSWLGSQRETDSVCDRVCGQSLKSWFDSVASACSGYRISGALPTLLGGRIWSGYNQTCLKDTASGKYCGEIMDGFKEVDSIKEMPDNEICSYCWIEHLAVMQRSQYSAYDDFLESQLQYTLKRCGKTQNTTIPVSPIDMQVTSDFCLTDKIHTTVVGDTCDSIAIKYNVSSASLYASNSNTIRNCTEISVGAKLCLPPSCGRIWILQPSDTCRSIDAILAQSIGISPMGFVRVYNRWVDIDCTNLHTASDMAFGHVLCLGPQNGWFLSNSTIPVDTTIPEGSTGYSNRVVNPPKGTHTANGTTWHCGAWYVAVAEDTCGSIAFTRRTTINIFMAVNPSLGKSIPDCSNALKPGLAYCVLPNDGWDVEDDEPTLPPTTTTSSLPTSKAPPNGITTPQPTHSSIVDNCYKFRLVKTGETCKDVASQEGVSQQQLAAWNPSLKSDCSGIKPNSYLCVGVFTSIPSFQQFGCYTEAYVGAGGNVRALNYTHVRDHQTLTPEFCAIYCMKEQGRALFGLQFASQCWCGDSLTLGSTKAPDGDCNMPCTGNKDKMCGGPNRLNIYGAQGKPAPLAYRAYGCYTEGTNTRALGIANMQNDKLTVEMCANFCLSEKRTNHFNLQNRRECFCGNNLGIGAVPAPAKDCNVPCAGDAKQTCGGAKDRLSLYSTFINIPPLNFKYRGCYTSFPLLGAR